MAKAARTPLISGNWKMHHNHFEAIQTVQKLTYLLHKEDYDVVDVSVHPPFTDIRSVQTVIEADELQVALGAQHCHWEEKGAFTGEVSPAFLAKLNVAYVICGHSERREQGDLRFRVADPRNIRNGHDLLGEKACGKDRQRSVLVACGRYLARERHSALYYELLHFLVCTPRLTVFV